MTQEEKARAYDEAIIKAQKELRSCGSIDCDAARQIFRFFPELQESEDEKTCKWILEYLYDGLRKSDEQFKDQFKSAIAWLEKQGEQKLRWTEEDECYMGECISAIATKDCWSSEEKRKTKHWLKSLKQRMEEQQ